MKAFVYGNLDGPSALGQTDKLYELLKNIPAAEIAKNKAIQHQATVPEISEEDLPDDMICINEREESDAMTALMWAAARGHAPCAQALLEYGANYMLRNRYGRTACDLAEKNRANAITWSEATNAEMFQQVVNVIASYRAQGQSAAKEN